MEGGSKPEAQCSCGNFYGVEGTSTESGATISFPQNSKQNPSGPRTALDASFVHLPLYVQEEKPSSLRSPRSSLFHSHYCSTGGFLESYHHLSALQQAATSPLEPPCLCLKCIQRVERAIDADTTRMQDEILAYRDAVKDGEARLKGWKHAIQEAAQLMQGDKVLSTIDGLQSTNDEEWERTEEAFRSEIAVMEETCRQHRDELAHLRSLQREQALALQDLDHIHDLMADEQNALELMARAFDNDQEQHSRVLAKIQGEVGRLSSASIRLPSVLLQLQVDIERGLRYPLINELRLAYRPKGDVQWSEISAAWSLAAHLLLVVGTLFHFQSLHWKIVPLSNCAKLIYHPNDDISESGADDGKRKRRAMVYNLGHPKAKGSKALLAWNALVHELVQHVSLTMKQACESGIFDATKISSLPFEASPTKIGSITLTQLDENDDVGWSRAIHCMASDLLWLSECTSMFVLQEVLLPFVGSKGREFDLTADQ